MSAISRRASAPIALYDLLNIGIMHIDVIMLGTSARIGEVLALRKCDIDDAGRVPGAIVGTVDGGSAF